MFVKILNPAKELIKYKILNIFTNNVFPGYKVFLWLLKNHNEKKKVCN